MQEYYRSLKLKGQERYLQVASDIRLKDLSGLTEELFNEICLLEPFGDGNTEPIFEFIGEVVGARLLKEKHLVLTLEDRKHNTIKLIGFYATPEWQATKVGQVMRSQFTLTKNEFRGKVTIEGNLISLERI